jgi:hypothetical protein
VHVKAQRPAQVAWLWIGETDPGQVFQLTDGSDREQSFR